MSDPATHYDRVTEAWRLLLGEELHYGVFERAGEPLETATRRLTRRMTEAAALRAGLDVLDVGCGTGAPAAALAGAHGCRVTAVTTSAVGATLTTRRARSSGLAEAVRAVRADATASPFAPGAFDRVWVLESSHLMRAKDRLFAECARILRPGGRLVLCDIVLRRSVDLAAVMRRRDEFLLLREVFADAKMEPLAVYETLAATNGLTVEERVDLTATTRPTFGCWRDNAKRHRTTVEELLGAAGLERFVRATTVLERFWDDGTLGYGLLAATKPR